MKILCVIDCLGAGGAQRQLVEIALGLKQFGNQINFLTYHPDSFHASNLAKEGVSITLINSKNYISRFLRMRRFIREGNYNAVISFLEASNFICELAGLPYRKWILVVGERSANPNILKSVKQKIYRWFHLLADHVVANSEANMKIIKSINPLLPDSKCRVIYNLINSSNWNPAEDYVPRKNGKLKLVVAASHQRIKNLQGLLQATTLLNDREKSLLEIEWYGDGIDDPDFDDSFTEAKKFMKLHHLEEIISFYPATQEINRKIQLADVVGLFSFYEGFPNAICEGMACAKPVICSEVSDIPALLSYDKNLLFQPWYKESIHKTLSYVITLTNNQLIAIGQLNLKLAKDNFDKETILKKYMDLVCF